MLKFILKNVFRKKFVAVLSSMGIGFGLMLMFVLGAFNAGVNAQLNENFSKVLGVVEITEAEQQGSNSQLPTTIIGDLYDTEIGSEIQAYNVKSQVSSFYTAYYRANNLLKNDDDNLAVIGINQTLDQEWGGPTTKVREGGSSFEPNTFQALIDSRIHDNKEDFDMNSEIGENISLYLDYPNTETNIINLEIVGIYEEEDTGAPDFVPRTYNIYISLPTAWNITETGWSEAYEYFDYYTQVDVRFPAEETEIIDGYIETMRTVDLGVNIEAYSLAAFQEELRENLSIFDSFSVGISAITALAGGMAIIVAQLNSVSQRMKEFAIMKSTGWKNSHILKTVIYESLTLGALGALLGLGFGFGLIELFSQGFGPFGAIQSIVTPQLIFQIVGFALGIGLIGGIYPGLKASKVRPVMVLKGG